jgi:diguanylate cyclase (GGDEF)-like protein/PAS domain S-box-containing protein
LHRIDGDTTPLTNPVIIIRPLEGSVPERNGCLIQIIDETNSAIREKTLRAQALALRAQEEQLRTLFEAINDSVLFLDKDGSIVALNDTACRRWGGEKDAMLGRKFLTFLPSPNANIHKRHFEALASSGMPQRFEDSLGEYTYLVSMFPVPNGHGAVHRIAMLASDITERKAFERRIFHLAHHDALTGLPNRAYLQDRLEHAIDLAKRMGRRLALMFLDLDHFKAVNDTMGHDSGDALLNLVAGKLQSSVRVTDTVARMGGDEFVVLLEPAGQDEDIARLTEKIISTLDLRWGSESDAIRVTTSIGVAVFPDNGHDARLLMKAADTAMYVAKAGGRNTFRFFSAEMTERTMERLHLERDIRDAISREEFELYYQPKVCFRSRKPCGVEVLLRWRHGERGLVSPAEFIPLAEETGLIVEIGEWVLEAVCQQIAKWIREGRQPVPIAVNVSPKQLFSGDFVALVISCIERYSIPSRYLQIEITESAVMADPIRAATTLAQLRELGINIAIDDFGTGYSSLSYLSRLPIDVIKIDRSFVAGLADRRENLEIINAIISLARALKMIVVAEGIETKGDVEVLTNASCHLGQGYLFARPMQIGDLERWLDARQPDHECWGCK